MNGKTKSIALFDDGSKVSNLIRLHFQKGSGFTVTRVYSREELVHRMKEKPFDIVIFPAKSPVRAWSSEKNDQCICLSWSVVEVPKHADHLLRHPSFLFEIETHETLLSYHTSGYEPVREQLAGLSRLLQSIEHYHQDFERFQTDTGMLQSIVEDSVTGILYLVRNTIQWANHEALRFLGRTEHELKGKEFSSLFTDHERYREFTRNISKKRDGEGWGTVRCTLVRASGEEGECRIRMRRLNPMDPQKGYLVFLEDNAERRHLEYTLGEYQEKMARNEAKYLDILQQMNHIIIKTDLDGTITFWNTRAETTLEYPGSDAAGKNLIALIADPGSRTAQDMSVLLYDSGATQDSSTLHVCENRRMSGTHVWVAWNTLVYRDSLGAPAGILWIGQDISDVGEGCDPGTAPGHWKHQLLEGTDIREDVFDMIFHISLEIGRSGRESRKVGTSFVIGDAERVMAQSRQCSINAFEGKRPEQRMVQVRGNIENIKNLALLDGAFVIDGSGFIHASSRHLLADTTGIEVPEGYGTRHASVAAMTNITRSVGIVISESGGTVTIFKEGTIVKQIAP